MLQQQLSPSKDIGQQKVGSKSRNHFTNLQTMCKTNIRIWDCFHHNRKNDLILIMTPEKQDKTLELSEHWSVDSTLARNEVIMKRTYQVKLVKCDKICSNY